MTPPPRFVPTGSDPEVALDTQKGSLCRTVAAALDATDKYSKLPMCTIGNAAPTSQEERSSVWDSESKKAPLDAMCYRNKNLLPFVLAANPAIMKMTSGCIIENHTSTDQRLLGSLSYDAILRASDGSMVRKHNVTLASSETVIPAHGRIEGGLGPNVDCSSEQAPALCLADWLGNARELVLVSNGAIAVAHIRMDRDTDPLGIR